jgi:YkoY family integral membrane protein
MDFLHTILGDDIQAGLLIILNLIVIESLLSVDNAAVLATMVMDLPKEQREKALKYGIIGAYVFRGVCLFLAAWLVKIWWLKPLGGLYLLYLAFDYFRKKSAKGNAEEDEEVDKNKSWIYKSTVGLIGNFWATVALVEVMDLAFSIDNVFAAVAFTDNIYLIYIGVFIGILAMRFVAQAFVKLMEKFTFLETIAFIVIGVLGIKLTSSVFTHFSPDSPISHAIEGEKTDLFVSIFTVAIFIIPVLSSLLLNYPKKNKSDIEVVDKAEEVLEKS